jgi:hypothetical protein
LEEPELVAVEEEDEVEFEPAVDVALVLIAC